MCFCHWHQMGAHVPVCCVCKLLVQSSKHLPVASLFPAASAHMSTHEAGVPYILVVPRNRKLHSRHRQLLCRVCLHDLLHSAASAVLALCKFIRTSVNFIFLYKVALQGMPLSTLWVQLISIMYSATYMTCWLLQSIGILSSQDCIEGHHPSPTCQAPS